MAQSEVAGKYVTAFIASAAEVSPVFEKKAKEVLANHGIEDTEPDDWVVMDNFVDALASVEEQIGDKTLTEGGRVMAGMNDLPDSVDTIKGGLENLNQSHQNAHRNATESDHGAYLFEQMSGDEVRMSCSKDYPYPNALGRGVFEGIVKEFAAGTVSVSSEPVSDGDLKPEEGAAYVVSWS